MNSKRIKVLIAVIFAAALLACCACSFAEESVWNPIDDPINDAAYITDFLITNRVTGTGPFDDDNEPGNDADGSNEFVRSFDTIAYTLRAIFATRASDVSYDKAQLCFAARIDFSADDIEFIPSSLPTGSTYEIKSFTDTNGNPYQILYARFELAKGPNADNLIPGLQEFGISILVKNVPNGTEIAPTFYAWLPGNDVYADHAVKPNDITGVNLNGQLCTAHGDQELKSVTDTPVTVSAKLKMNVKMSHIRSGYDGVLDFNTGNNPNAVPAPITPAAHYGAGQIKSTVAAVGIMVVIQNEDETKGLRGLLFPHPDTEITFDLLYALSYHPLDLSYGIDISKPYSSLNYAPMLYSYGGHTSSDKNADGRSSPLKLHLPENGPLPANYTEDQRRYIVYDGGDWSATLKRSESKISITISGFDMDGIFPNKPSSNADYPEYFPYPDAENNQFPSNINFGCVSIGELHFAFPHYDQSTGQYIAERFGSGDLYFVIKDVNLRAYAEDRKPGSTETEGNWFLTHVEDNSNQANPILDKDATEEERKKQDDVLDIRAFLSNPGYVSPIIHYSRYNNETQNYSSLTDDCFKNGKDWSVPGTKIGITSGLVEISDSGKSENKIIGYDDFLKIDASAISFVDELVNDSKNIVRAASDPITPDGDVDYVMGFVKGDVNSVRILYAVKADGTNWNRDENGVDIEMQQASPEDENLRWYNTLSEAQQHGKVVALLFQYRGNHHQTTSLMYPRYKVSAYINEDAVVDDTYMITHQVRAWKRNNVTTPANEADYATALSFRTAVNGKLVVDTSAGEFPETPAILIDTSYNRLVYNDDGTTSGGNGDNHFGDTVYIASFTPKILINPLNGFGAKSNSFNASTGYIADFSVSPSLIMPSYNQTGTEGADSTANVTVSVVLPKGLEYVPHSSYWGGAYSFNTATQQTGTITNSIVHLTENTLDSGKEDVYNFVSGSRSYPIGVSMDTAYFFDETDNEEKTRLTYRFTGVPLLETADGTNLAEALKNNIYFSAQILPNGSETSWELHEVVTITADDLDIVISNVNGNRAEASLLVQMYQAEGLSVKADKLFNEQDEILGWTLTYENHTTVEHENALFFGRIAQNTDFAGTYDLVEWSLDLSALQSNDVGGLELWYTTQNMDDFSAEDFSVGTLAQSGFKKNTALEVKDGRLVADFSGNEQVTGWILVGKLGKNASFSVHHTIKPTGNAPGNMYRTYGSFKAGASAPLTAYDPVYVVGRELSGCVWHDMDRDGIRDEGEPFVQGVTVTPYVGGVKLTTDITGAALPNVVTDANGEYRFTKLPAGSFVIEFENVPDMYIGVTQMGVGSDETRNSDADENKRILNIALSKAEDIGHDYTEALLHLDMGLLTPPSASYQINLTKRIVGTPAQEETYLFNIQPLDQSAAQGSFTLPAPASVTGEGVAAFDPIVFFAAGEYTFVVSEVRGLAIGCLYDVSRLHFTITVEEIENGQLDVTGVLCRKDDQPADPVFVNTYHSGDLTIAKTVAGNAGELDRTWHFKVTLMSPSGREYRTALHYDGSASGTITSGDTIALRHGEKITIRNIPEGITYTVTETEANSDGYNTVSEGTAGIITDGTAAQANFTNTRAREALPLTGDSTAPILLSALLMASFASLLLLTRRKQYHR